MTMSMHTMRKLSLLAICGAIAAGCSGKSPAAPSPSPSPTPTVASITVSGANSIDAGSSANMTASAVRSDGSTESVTASATWQSSNPAVASVSSAGRVTAGAPGSSVISASFGGRTGQLTVQVVAVDNVQVVTIALTRVVIDGTCDTDNIFETSGDGEFTFRFEVERSGTGRTQVWSTSRQAFTKGAHPITGRGIQFTRNVTRGEDFILWFTATEWDGLLGADPKLNGRSSGATFVYQGGRWTDRTSISLGNDSCGATIQWTVSSSSQ